MASAAVEELKHKLCIIWQISAQKRVILAKNFPHSSKDFRDPGSRGSRVFACLGGIRNRREAFIEL